jgi:hypothetical protein
MNLGVGTPGVIGVVDDVVRLAVDIESWARARSVPTALPSRARSPTIATRRIVAAIANQEVRVDGGIVLSLR